MLRSFFRKSLDPVNCCSKKAVLSIVQGVHPMERPAHADGDTDHVERRRCSVHTCRSFNWVNIEDKVDIELTQQIAKLKVHIYRMELQIRCNIFARTVKPLLNFLVYCIID